MKIKAFNNLVVLNDGEKEVVVNTFLNHDKSINIRTKESAAFHDTEFDNNKYNDPEYVKAALAVIHEAADMFAKYLDSVENPVNLPHGKETIKGEGEE